MPNLKFASVAVLELLAFNTQKITGSRDPSLVPVRIFFTSGFMSGLFLGACVALALMEILAFNAQNSRGHVNLATPLFALF